MSPISTSPIEKGNIFKDGWMDTNEMGLPFFPRNDIFMDSSILKIVHALYSKMNGDEIQSQEIKREIDRYWMALFLQSIDSPLLKFLPWQSFVLKISDVFSLDQLPDIGPCIRKLSVHRDISDNVMCRIIQYSLPYVKHNRLNFPRYADVPHTALVDLIQITLAMLVSMYPHSTKQALWQLRFKIYIYIYHLISRGNKYDHYTWCLNNINLIRIAMIEYFVYFVRTNMPAEFEILQTLFGASGNIETTFRQFLVNVEYFRTQNLQSTDLNWESIHKKSHYIIERCNRLCKAKPKLVNNHIKSAPHTLHSGDLKSILNIPRCTHPFHAKIFNPEISFDDMQHVYNIHKNLFVHTLPRSVWRIQTDALRNMMQRDALLYSNCMYLYVCFRCIHIHPHVMQNMRIDTHGGKYCQYCQKSDAIHPINVFGQIVSIFSKKYYFCHECLLVHEWKSMGIEFFNCPLAKTKHKKTKSDCILCKRTLNVNAINVLDTSLGVMQNICLCVRHTPREYQMKYIHSLSALVDCLRQRQEIRFGIR